MSAYHIEERGLACSGCQLIIDKLADYHGEEGVNGGVGECHGCGYVRKRLERFHARERSLGCKGCDFIRCKMLEYHGPEERGDCDGCKQILGRMEVYHVKG